MASFIVNLGQNILSEKKVNYIFGSYPLSYLTIWLLTFQMCQFGHSK